MIDQRKRDILTRIIEQYIASAHPIGSVTLVEKYRLGCSSATIRNCMAALEELGYMYQPHLSAGRIPTETGYRIYLQYVRPSRLPARAHADLAAALDQESEEAALRTLAQTLSAYAEEIAFVHRKSGAVFFGLSYAAEKPEYEDADFRRTLARIIDTLDTLVARIAVSVTREPQVWIGQESRFSPQCSAVLMRFPFNRQECIAGILGPMRMNYSRNIALMNTLKNALAATHEVC